ncbi:unnamed protein product [Caenorhabditis angaria]|uniref:Uncharacterized protein n=1 Tax=Caenorhabditis angaria TaxID=860376 RepID=A0A9P1IYG6_9PELO|nr:unnamed protein product [Caenorhabditis angaria]
MKEDVYLLILAVLILKIPIDSHSLHRGNIYGIKVQNGNRTRQVVIKPTSWIRKHKISGRKALAFAKIRSFEQRKPKICEDEKNISIVKIKRIGGGYPYGPKNGSLSENRICKMSNNFEETSIRFLMREIYKDLQKSWELGRKKSAIWCSYCRAYWKRQKSPTRVDKCCST